jgi:hypothetical protein
MMTHKELARIEELHEHIDELLMGEATNICLNTLCSLIAGQCAMYTMNGRVSKQHFIADIVECIDVWQDHFSKQISEES